jgi:tRNA pseudouridine55 synthase
MQFDHRVLLIDKPSGMSSFGAVRLVRRALRLAKVGHCGSLDPLATGLLVLCTGAATRVANEFVGLPKRYVARVRFGRATDSYDADGRVTHEAPVPELEAAAVRRALERFQGEIEQRPPMVSALKVQGKRLYALARAGQEVERVPRKVMVYALELADLGVTHAELHVHCGRGCYVRSIAHELGEALGVPAHLEALRRVAIGPFRVDDAVLPAALAAALEDALARGSEASLQRAVLPLSEALAFMPVLRVRQSFEARLGHGVQPGPGALVEPPRAAGRHRLLSQDGERLLALADAAAAGDGLALALVFEPPLDGAAGGGGVA